MEFEQGFDEKGRRENIQEETSRYGHGVRQAPVVGENRVFRLKETFFFRELGLMDKQCVKKQATEQLRCDMKIKNDLLQVLDYLQRRKAEGVM